MSTLTIFSVISGTKEAAYDKVLERTCQANLPPLSSYSTKALRPFLAALTLCKFLGLIDIE